MGYFVVLLSHLLSTYGIGSTQNPITFEIVMLGDGQEKEH